MENKNFKKLKSLLKETLMSSKNCVKDIINSINSMTVDDDSIVKPIDLFNLIKKLPENKKYFIEEPPLKLVTTEWLVGEFFGRSFTGNTYESAIDDMIRYFNKEKLNDSCVGDIVRKSGWPNLDEVYIYLNKDEK